MSGMFGIVAFDDRGAIKTWSQMRAVCAHNNREKAEPHCDPEMPPPVHLHGSGNLIADVKALLLQHDVDPARLRKNVAIAFEVILSASHAFFEQSKNVGRWIVEALEFAKKMWGKDRVASIVLHLDEYTPHMHVVIVPLVQRIFKRRPEDGMTWTLNGRSVAGPGEFQKVHDEYAKVMAPLGLVRGKSGSRAKYRPYAEELAVLDAQRAVADEAEAVAIRLADENNDAEQRRKAQWNDEFAALQRLRAEQENNRQQLLKDREQVRSQAAWLSQEKMRVQERLTSTKLALAKAQADRETAEATLNAIQQAADEARAFQASLRGLPTATLPAKTNDALLAANRLQRATKAIVVPDEDHLADHYRRRVQQIQAGR